MKGDDRFTEWLRTLCGADAVDAGPTGGWTCAPSDVGGLSRLRAGLEGAGRTVRLDAPPRAPGEVNVSSARLVGVRVLDPTSGLARVAAGTTWGQAEWALRRAGHTLGPIPQALQSRPILRSVHENDRLRPSARYGQLVDSVQGLTAVLPDGSVATIETAPRRATGPDLGRSLWGTHAALGWLAEVDLGVWPLEAPSATMAFDFPTAEALVEADGHAARAGLRPPWAWARRRDPSGAPRLFVGADPERLYGLVRAYTRAGGRSVEADEECRRCARFADAGPLESATEREGTRELNGGPLEPRVALVPGPSLAAAWALWPEAWVACSGEPHLTVVGRAPQGGAVPDEAPRWAALGAHVAGVTAPDFDDAVALMAAGLARGGRR